MTFPAGKIIACSLTIGLFAGGGSAHGASFDCSKASSYVERQICKDEKPFSSGLSLLDDDLDFAYKIILRHASDPESIRKAQRAWLKRRNSCKNSECIEKAYKNRLQTIHAKKSRPKSIIPNKGDTVESHLFPHEADKLLVLRKVVKTHQFKLIVPKTDPRCSKFLKDLPTESVNAVESNVRAITPYDPAIENWHSCDGKDPDDVNADPQKFYGGFGYLGVPPYRYYSLELDGDPTDGKEDLLYHETGWSPIIKYRDVGHTGYSWVDLKRCEFKGGVPMSELYLEKNNPGKFYNFSLIAKYKKKYFALSIHPSSRNKKYLTIG